MHRRVIEGVPGEEAPVWIQDRGGGDMRLRATIIIEDLDPVLTAISSRSGANGPLNPVTQYMLGEAARVLTDRLLDNGAPGPDQRDSVPRVLSSALGHQPFVESVLEMSLHQMLRRWPLATDWYSDVIAYILRPARFGPTYRAIMTQLPTWTRGTFGQFVQKFGDNMAELRSNERVIRVAEAFQSLWPDYPPVRDAMAGYRYDTERLWTPIYVAVMHCYDLRPLPGTHVTELAWAFNALYARDTLERLAGQHMTHPQPAGPSFTMAAWAALLLLAGSVTDAAGNRLTPSGLAALRPVAEFRLPG